MTQGAPDDKDQQYAENGNKTCRSDFRTEGPKTSFLNKRLNQSEGTDNYKAALICNGPCSGGIGVIKMPECRMLPQSPAWFIRCPRSRWGWWPLRPWIDSQSLRAGKVRNRPERFFHCGATSNCHQIRGCIQRIHLPSDGCFLTRLASTLNESLLDAFSVLIQFHDLDGGPAGARDLDLHVQGFG